jgi:ABC-type transport system involved in multi-copper enzyme maturation permease subunit
LIRDDLQANTLSFLLTRPWTRARLFLAKFLTQLAWTQILALSSGVLLLAVGLISRIPGILSLTPLFLVTVLLVVLVFGALSALIGLLHRRYLVIGAIYGLVIEVGIAQIPSNINTLSMTRHLRTLLGLNPRLQELFGWSSQGALFSLMVILIATLVFLGLATCLFNWVEYHHSEEMRK